MFETHFEHSRRLLLLLLLLFLLLLCPLFCDIFFLKNIVLRFLVTYLHEHLSWSNFGCYLLIISRSLARLADFLIAHRRYDARECHRRYHAAPRNGRRYIARTMIARPVDHRIGRRDNKDRRYCASAAYYFWWASVGMNLDRGCPVKLHLICIVYYNNRM